MFVDALTTDALVFLGIKEYFLKNFESSIFFCFSFTKATLKSLMVICLSTLDWNKPLIN